jgi:hypothetical protein
MLARRKLDQGAVDVVHAASMGKGCREQVTLAFPSGKAA